VIFYDDLYRLTRETRRNIVGTQDARGSYTDDTAVYDYSYAWDLSDNRASMTNNVAMTTTNGTYNNMNQLTQWGNITYGYDSNGSMVTKTVNSQTTTVAYDFDDRLKQITYPNSSTNTFLTNVAGGRMQRVDSTGTTKFLYDGARLIAETDGSGNLTAAYDFVHTLDRQVRGTDKKYFHFDSQGSTRQLTDTNQGTTDTYAFDSFGSIVASSGTTTTPHKYIGNQVYHTDKDSGLQLLGLRYYDPSIGRFITADPVGAESNLYNYARSNPVNRIDPGGT
jgi:RHS repeat-associated protein